MNGTPRIFRPASLLVQLCLAVLLLTAVGGRAADDAGSRSVFARGAGGRPLALGGAYVAADDDLSAMIWNPAALASVQRKGLYATHTDLIGYGFSEQFLVMALPSWRIGTFSLSMRRFAVDGIEGRNDRGAITDPDMKNAESEFALGYGRTLGTAWRFGATIKMQQQELAGYSDGGLGLDLGLQVKPLLAAGRTGAFCKGLSLGVQLRNVVEPNLRLLDEDTPDPAGIRGGLAVDYPLGEHVQALLVTDLEKTKTMDPRLHAGLEIRLLELLALRAGSLDGLLTAGTGIVWKNFQLDYSFEDNPLETVHRMGFGVAFGETADAQRQAVLDRQEQYVRERLDRAFDEQNNERIGDLVAGARSALERRDTDRAFQLVGTLRVLEPDNAACDELEAAAYRVSAQEQEETGNLAAATLNYGRCLALDPSDAVARARLDRVRRESDRQTQRTAVIRELYDRAMSAFTDGDLVTARDLFTQLLEQNPADKEAVALLNQAEQTLFIRAQSLAERSEGLAVAGRLDAARAALAEARDLDPDCPAIPAAERAIAGLRESDRRARDLAHQALSDRRTNAVASAPATAAPVLPPAARSFAKLPSDRQAEVAELYRKGMEEAERGRRDNALRYWELVWSEAPDYQQVAGLLKEEYLARGMEAFAAGDLDRAIGYWEQTQNIDPDDPRARGYLARAQEQLTRIKEIRSTQG